MNDFDPDRFRDSLAAYALDALEPAEAKELESHLERCDRCRAELRWLTPALQALPETVPRLEPSRALRERLMAEVRAEERPNDHAASQRRAGALGRFRGRLTGPFSRPVVALATLLLVLAVVFAGYEISDDGSGKDNPSTVVVGRAPGVVAAVTREGEQGRLKLSNVPDLPPDRVLEAWVRRDGDVEAVPILFVPNGKGDASTQLGDLRGVDRVMVTTEPPGGSKAPTSAPIASVPISADG